MGRCIECGGYAEFGGLCPACRRAAERRRFDSKRDKENSRIASEQIKAIARENRRAARDLQDRIDADKREREEERRREHDYQEELRKKDRTRWYGSEWADHLISHPEDAFQCDWSKMTGADCAKLFRERPETVPSDVDWSKRFNADDWVSLLSRQPQFGEKCDWKKLGRDHWMDLLSAQESFSSICPWKTFDTNDWVYILSEHADYCSECPWETLSDEQVGQIALKSVRIFSHDELKVWSRLIPDDLEAVLIKNPAFTDYCPKSEFCRLKTENWLRLLPKYPKLARKCDWSQFDIDDFKIMLGRCPALAKSSDFTHLSVDDCVKFMIDFPKFADAINRWNDLKINHWMELLPAHPEFAERCPVLKDITDDSWTSMVEKEPRLSRYRKPANCGKTSVIEDKQSFDVATNKGNVKTKDENQKRPVAQSVKHEQEKQKNKPLSNSGNVRGCSVRQKKRWKFILLGLLLGWMGAHYIYAKRWGLFSLHVAAFIGLLIAPPLGLLWLATWFGGTLFVKKDGKGNGFK